MRAAKAVALSIALSGCSSADEHIEAAREPEPSASAVASESIVATASAAPDDALVVREGETRLDGVYGEEPKSDKHMFQGTFLTLDDGSRVILSYDARPERAPLVGKRVVVIGKVYMPDGRMTRAVSGKHCDARVVVAAAH